MEIVFHDQREKFSKSERENIIKALTSEKKDNLYYMFFWQSINAILEKNNFPLCIDEVLKVIIRVIDKETTVTAYIINKWEKGRYCEITYKAAVSICASTNTINEAELKVWSRK